ncbi:MAG: hypothetical protein LH650_12365 [Chloroflexi bacterium]|nr:hypothetical protein [Chloroflexota bacterium]
MQRQLVERAMRGDHDAFGDLVRASTDRLYAVASLNLRDGDRGQDAVQEALVLAWLMSVACVTPMPEMPGSTG